MTVHQLRMSTVRADQCAAFHAAQARPLVERHGFCVVGQREGRDDLASITLAGRVLRLLVGSRHPGQVCLVCGAATDGDKQSGVGSVAWSWWRRPQACAGQRDLKACR